MHVFFSGSQPQVQVIDRDFDFWCDWRVLQENRVLHAAGNQLQSTKWPHLTKLFRLYLCLFSPMIRIGNYFSQFSP